MKIATSAPRAATLVGGGRISGDFGASADALIRALAESQSGRVSRAQLLAFGVKPDAVVRRLRNGRLEREHHGVYRLPNTEGLRLGAETAALLACGEEAMLSHHSAATLWRLRPGIARPVHVTVLHGGGRPTPVGVAVHRSRTMAPADIRLHEGLPVTSPARTVLDAAASLPDRDVERLLDEGLFLLRILTRNEIDDVLARAGNHPGRPRLARVAAAGRTRPNHTDSPPEEALLKLIRAAGLPEPHTQFPLLDYRLDLFWPKFRLAVEVDAYGTHGSRSRFEADRNRDARLLAEEGVAVLRVTQLAIETRPYEVIALVARALGQRESELRARR